VIAPLDTSLMDEHTRIDGHSSRIALSNKNESKELADKIFIFVTLTVSIDARFESIHADILY